MNKRNERAGCAANAKAPLRGGGGECDPRVRRCVRMLVCVRLSTRYWRIDNAIKDVRLSFGNIFDLEGLRFDFHSGSGQHRRVIREMQS